MFNIGPSEFIVIGIIILILIRPKDLPAVLRKLAKGYRELRKTIDELTAMKDEFVKQVEDLSKEVSGVKGEFEEALKVSGAGAPGTEPGTEVAAAGASPASQAGGSGAATPPRAPETEAALAWNSEARETQPLASFQAGQPGKSFGYDGKPLEAEVDPAASPAPGETPGS